MKRLSRKFGSKSSWQQNEEAFLPPFSRCLFSFLSEEWFVFSWFVCIWKHRGSCWCSHPDSQVSYWQITQTSETQQRLKSRASKSPNETHPCVTAESFERLSEKMRSSGLSCSSVSPSIHLSSTSSPHTDAINNHTQSQMSVHKERERNKVRQAAGEKWADKRGQVGDVTPYKTERWGHSPIIHFIQH